MLLTKSNNQFQIYSEVSKIQLISEWFFDVLNFQKNNAKISNNFKQLPDLTILTNLTWIILEKSKPKYVSLKSLSVYKAAKFW